MRIVTVLLFLGLGVIACKQEATSNKSTTEETTETPITSQQPVEKVKSIELADPEADAYANNYDDLLDALNTAYINQDPEGMKAIEAQMQKMDEQSAEIELKLQSNEIDLYQSYINKRRSAAAEILSNLQ